MDAKQIISDAARRAAQAIFGYPDSLHTREKEIAKIEREFAWVGEVLETLEQATDMLMVIAPDSDACQEICQRARAAIPW